MRLASWLPLSRTTGPPPVELGRVGGQPLDHQPMPLAVEPALHGAAAVGWQPEDATFAMPPYPAWWQGRDVIAAFAGEPVHRYLPARANGQAANASYRWHPHRSRYVAEALEVLTLEGAMVKEMTAFMMPEVFSQLRSPGRVPPLTSAPRIPSFFDPLADCFGSPRLG
jgi:hypothetical protein